MIEQSHQKCKHVDPVTHVRCKIYPNFGYEDTGKAEYCGDHKLEGMLDVHHPKCSECKQPARFAYKGDTTPMYCYDHKKQGMINICSRYCELEEAHRDKPVQANYGFRGSKIPLRCAKHKTKDMYDVRHKLCQYLTPLCSGRALFGYPEDGILLYCGTHAKLIDPVKLEDLSNKKCEYIDPKTHVRCKKRPYFGETGTNHSHYCSIHKDDNMTDICHKKCDKCHQLTPSYGHIGAKTPTRCSDCRDDDMIELKHEQCHVCNDAAALYGIPCHKATHCTRHKEVGEIIYPTKKCITNGCRLTAIYGESEPTHCEDHHVDGENDLVQKKCAGCNLINIIDAEGFCPTCNPKLVKRVRLVQQNKVCEFFNYNKMKYEIYDHTIDQGTCGLERPDFVFDGIYHKIVVEIDEHQHQSYTCECEQARMINISQSLGMQTIFIRFNPDRYKPSTGREIIDIHQRYETLKQVIEHWQTHRLPEDGFCFVTQLYFREDNPRDYLVPILLYCC